MGFPTFDAGSTCSSFTSFLAFGAFGSFGVFGSRGLDAERPRLLDGDRPRALDGDRARPLDAERARLLDRATEPPALPLALAVPARSATAAGGTGGPGGGLAGNGCPIARRVLLTSKTPATSDFPNKPSAHTRLPTADGLVAAARLLSARSSFAALLAEEAAAAALLPTPPARKARPQEVPGGTEDGSEPWIEEFPRRGLGQDVLLLLPPPDCAAPGSGSKVGATKGVEVRKAPRLETAPAADPSAAPGGAMPALAASDSTTASEAIPSLLAPSPAFTLPSARNLFCAGSASSSPLGWPEGFELLVRILFLARITCARMETTEFDRKMMFCGKTFTLLPFKSSTTTCHRPISTLKARKVP